MAHRERSEHSAREGAAQRIIIAVIGGLATLGGSLLVVRWLGPGGRTPFAEVGKFLIPIWFCLSALNLWVGVRRAGYSIDEELPIFLLIFTVPASFAALLWWRSSG
jgi:hypothetical protein